MIITDPRFAPRRDDLPYLRHRVRPKTSAPVAQPSAPQAPKISFDRPGRQRHEPAPTPPPPTPPPPTLPATPVPTVSLDLDAPLPTAAATVVTAPVTPVRRVRDDVRVRAGERCILTVAQPTVTLTRLQSAIGTLTVEAACSAEVGDLRLGAAYQLRSGLSGTMQMTQGERFAPPHSRRPILVGAREQFERVSVDLRQSTELDRLVVYGFAGDRQPLRWGGTLIITTFGGAKIELPIETLQGGDVAVLVSLYNIAGEFVLRAEMQTLNGDVREAARAYGFDRITWLDDRTPIS